MSQLPPYVQLIYPLLQVLNRESAPIAASVAHDLVADYVGLSEEQRQEVLPESSQAVYRNRTGWAQDRLKRHGLSKSPKRGYWEITEAGRELLAKNPSGLSAQQIKDLSSISRSIHSTQDAEPPLPTAGSIAESSEAVEQSEEDRATSPDERLTQSLKEIRDSVAFDLLEQLYEVTPARFESIVLDVLHALGYGLSRDDLAHVGRSADAGIDGVISLDKLGLDKVYVQAKKWSSNTIGRPDIQAFYGALAGQRAARGVFITTSTFSKSAVEYAQSIDKSIALIDGSRLVQLMIELGIGVSHEIVRRPRIDSDYFETN